MVITVDTGNTKYFRPKAHILRLLGEELIKSPIMAIYELVKNSYDADSQSVDVVFENGESQDKGKINIQDYGLGLTGNILASGWLAPGTDHRKPINSMGERQIFLSPIYKRVPMGEKGVGRFAVHKLGDKISLVTRPADIVKNNDGSLVKELLDYEIRLTIDWGDFSQSKYLEDIPIKWVIEKDTSKFHFKNDSGTLIEISELKEPWTRGMARGLKRNVVSMLSPKSDEKNFKINLDFRNEWLSDFPDANQILELAPYKFTALLDEKYNLTYDYNFSLALNDEFGSREHKQPCKNLRSLMIPSLRKALSDENYTEEQEEEFIAELMKRENPFGSLMIEIYAFDLDSATLKNYTYDAKVLKDILKQHSGIKVFKNDMRVYSYGEPGNDWLELDNRRVNNKSWFSNNQIIGFVFLDSKQSTVLTEKTDREGFISNKAFQYFLDSIIAMLNEFKTERLIDRSKWLDSLNQSSNKHNHPDQLTVFNELIDSTDFSQVEQKQLLKNEAGKLKEDFDKKKDTLLIPAGVGMTASVALHEIEKLIPRMKEVINTLPFQKGIANEKVEELEDYLNGILSVLRKGGNKQIDFKEAIYKAFSNYKSKLNRRGISTEFDIDNSIKTILCDKRYFVTMIMNIIDNSVYWLDTTYKKEKGIYIKTVCEDEKLSIIIVDSGPGFQDEAVDLVRPFFTRKESGIGIGLYLIDTIMIKYGKLEFIESDEELSLLSIPSKYRGAAIKLTFSGKK